MSLFRFDESHLLGTVREVDSRTAAIVVKAKDLPKAKVGHLVAMKIGDGAAFIIGIVMRITKAAEKPDPFAGYRMADVPDGMTAPSFGDEAANTVRLTLVGTVDGAGQSFSRSLVRMPDIDAECCTLEGEQLDAFMGLVSRECDRDHSLELGEYSISRSAAFLDGNKFFQRHAALLGSTGSGKSWTVASIIERAARLPSSNLIVFDIHGEYGDLGYAHHLRIPGPEDLTSAAGDLLFLPYWLLTADELQSMFIDTSEYGAHNQTSVFQKAVMEGKRRTLMDMGDGAVLEAFTLDSPVPFDIERVIEEIDGLNTEMVPSSRGMKQGPHHGQFTRLLTRLRSKLADRRYGFLYQAPAHLHEYGAMGDIARQMMSSGDGSSVKVIDFSDVPSDILPVIVGLVARVIYQVQFWTPRDRRRPLAFICDEAHLYLPQKQGHNPVERRAIENFERIAKEGRKYGVSLVIVSQRPSDVNPTILSQASNMIALRLANADDQAIVRKLMPESLAGLTDALPVLDIGEAIVVGDSVLLPSRIRINPPTEAPLSATLDVWSMWQESATVPDFNEAVDNMRRQGRRRKER